MVKPKCILNDDIENELYQIYNQCCYQEDFLKVLELNYGFTFEEQCSVLKYFSKIPKGNYNEHHCIPYCHKVIIEKFIR